MRRLRKFKTIDDFNKDYQEREIIGGQFISLVKPDEGERTVKIDYFIEGLIARYRCYKGSNDDPDREVLKDLTENGHDIQLKNFAFSGGSGYGKYAYDFNSFTTTTLEEFTRTSSKIEIIKRKVSSNTTLIEKYIQTDEGFIGKYISPSLVINVKNPKKLSIYLDYYTEGGGRYKNVLVEGINKISPYTFDIDSQKYKKVAIRFNIEDDSNPSDIGITIEQIPDYKGALVGDGVDDYGICDNFPTLYIDRGYTVIGIRKYIDGFEKSPGYYSSLLTNGGRLNGAFDIELAGSNATSLNCGNFGSFGGEIFSVYDRHFFVQTGVTYNGKRISNGGVAEETPKEIQLFKNDSYICKPVALYALDIYDRDLTDEEIEKVKAEMIAEYERETGEVFGIVPDVYYDFTKGKNEETTVKDLSGFSRDGIVHNIDWNEDSGYTEGGLKLDGSDDYVEVFKQDKYRTVFLVTKTVGKSPLIGFYDQRSFSDGGNANVILSVPRVPAYQAGDDGPTYINGTLNKSITGDELKGVKHCICKIFRNNLSENLLLDINIGKVNEQVSQIIIYKFLGFYRELEEEEIQAVIKEYNLLDGVDPIEVN